MSDQKTGICKYCEEVETLVYDVYTDENTVCQSCLDKMNEELI